MSQPSSNPTGGQPAGSSSRLTAASIQEARATTWCPPGLSPEDRAKASPEEAARIEKVIHTLERLDWLLADLAKLDAVAIYNFDASVRHPDDGGIKGFIARLSGGKTPEQMNPRAALKSPAYLALWDELVARGFVPEIRRAPGNSKECRLFARMPSGPR